MSEMVQTQQEESKLTKGQEILDLAAKFQDAMKAQWDEAALEKITKQGDEIMAMAEGLKIKDEDTYKAANELLTRITHYAKNGESYCEPFKKAAYGPYATVLDIIKKIKDSTIKANKLLANELRRWRDEQEKKRQEEQRKADAERRKREEAERAKLNRKAEKELDKGNEEKADELLDAAEAAYVPPTVVESTTQKTETTDAGRVTYVKDWDVKVMSPMAVIKAIAAGELPESLVKVEITAVKKYARAMDLKRYNKNGLDIVRTERPQTRWNKG